MSELPNFPVLVVHLADEWGRTACTGNEMPLFNDSTTPRYLCPLCALQRDRSPNRGQRMREQMNSQLYSYTIAELTQHLEERAFPPDHILEITEDSWCLEHPLRCRLLQYDELSKTMLTLRETCATNLAMEHGLATIAKERRGLGRFVLSPKDIMALNADNLDLPPNLE